jgi:hypothetical protein
MRSPASRALIAAAQSTIAKAVGEAGSDVEELAAEVGSMKPGLRDEQFGCGFQVAQALGMGA